MEGEVSQSRGRQRCVLGIVLRRRLCNVTQSKPLSCSDYAITMVRRENICPYCCNMSLKDRQMTAEVVDMS